jgi:Cysteine-rich CPCC
MAPMTFAICDVCFWEDDPIQLEDPNYKGGANRVSLRQAQWNFILFRACDEKMTKHTRRPTKEEERDENWKPFE